jgi:hypothetical protein
MALPLSCTSFREVFRFSTWLSARMPSGPTALSRRPSDVSVVFAASASADPARLSTENNGKREEADRQAYTSG